jgi:choline dehydrogenase-like flavoprotein
MIRQLNIETGPALETDICVVGAGAAGLAFAAQFIRSPWRVLLLESGLREPDGIGEDLDTLVPAGVPHDGWRDGRVRALGGTTLAWHGQLVPMRASEAQERPWVPDSGWPFMVAELQPYYRRVEHLLRTEGPPYDLTAWQRLGMPPLELDENLLRVRFAQGAPRIRRNLGQLLRHALERSSNITVLLDATATAVHCTPDGGHCETVEVRSRAGVGRRVRARWFVLANGAIESARLLLASPSPGGRGVANSSDTVGRYFQDHISYWAGELQPRQRRQVQDVFDPRYINGCMHGLRLEPTDELMRREGWLNAQAHVAFQLPEAAGWLEVRRLLRSLQAGRMQLPSRDERLAMARNSWELSRLLMTRLLAQRRLSPSAGPIRLLVDVEQAPDPESRVTLSCETDCFGMPRARLQWRVGELEVRTLTGFARTVAAELERLSLGKVQLARGPEFGNREVLGAAHDMFHHMGTTRMSRSPKHGVTRHDLRCHDVDNLFIAGPSVFPAGGVASPTFTALALTMRLADHLKTRMRSTVPRVVVDLPVATSPPQPAEAPPVAASVPAASR